MYFPITHIKHLFASSHPHYHCQLLWILIFLLNLHHFSWLWSIGIEFCLGSSGDIAIRSTASVSSTFLPFDTIYCLHCNCEDLHTFSKRSWILILHCAILALSLSVLNWSVIICLMSSWMFVASWCNLPQIRCITMSSVGSPASPIARKFMGH